MNYVVTGATGNLGRLVVESLLAKDVPADRITATGRDVSKIADLAERGVRTLVADFNDPASLHSAFAGADKVLLVSGSEVGQRLAQHTNAIAAAVDAGVGLLAYTSVAGADSAQMKLAEEHLATEKVLADAGVPHVLLRNGWYHENYTAQLPTFLEHGTIASSAGEGRISGAARADFAEAAAAVLLADDQAGRVYELGGDESYSLDELAATVSEVTGRPVTHQSLPAPAYVELLVGVGLPAPYAEVLADSDLGIVRGELEVTTGDLSRLIGRPTTPVIEAVRAAV